jgi:hypothetical protein
MGPGVLLDEEITDSYEAMNFNQARNHRTMNKPPFESLGQMAAALFTPGGIFCGNSLDLTCPMDGIACVSEELRDPVLPHSRGREKSSMAPRQRRHRKRRAGVRM